MESITLSAEPLSVGRVRCFVRSMLLDRDMEPFAAELLASELATNVVRHVQTDFTVVVAFEPCVRVEIHDGLAASEDFREIVNNPPEVPVDSAGGRGLRLVRRLSSRSGLQDEPGIWDGKIMWFELDPPDLSSA